MPNDSKRIINVFYSHVTSYTWLGNIQTANISALCSIVISETLATILVHWLKCVHHIYYIVAIV